MTDIVLVHGSTQSAAGFWRLAEALQQRGHRVLTVDIPSAAATSSRAYAELLTAQLPEDLRHPVVAAHSAAGLLLPALAERLDAAHQVWMAAAVADYAGGHSLLEEIRTDPTAVFHAEWLGVDPTSDPVLATYFLFHDADLATLRKALTTVARCDLSAVYAETPPLNPAARPSTYLLPTADRALTRGGMLHVARERLHIDPVEVPGGHNGYVAHPDEIADTIDQATKLPAATPRPS
jgi:predicted alpha/beta hydrolase family esterase